MNREKPKILVVDDRNENLIAMKELLKNFEAEILLAQSGNDALSLTLRHDFSVVLLDVQMPVMDGFEVAHLLLNNEKTKHLPIIFLTAISKEDGYVHKGYEEGAVDFIFKPVDPVILRSKVNVFLELYSKRLELKEAMAALETKQKELQRSNEELNNFATVVSHDLKEPLRKILFYCEKINYKFIEQNDTECNKKMESVIKSGSRMSTLVNDLLAYSRVSIKKRELLPVDLELEVTEVLSDLEASIQSSQAKVELIDLPKLNADPIQMRQLFQNLISNCLKYHREGVPPQIVIRGFSKDSKTVEVTISDNGLGMTSEDADRIFKPFERLESGAHREGSGVGLATVRKIIDRHKGSITVLSRLGKGSIFVMKFPQSLTEDRIDSMGVDEDEAPFSNHYIDSPGAPKVLVAEDTPKFQSLFAESLKAHHYSFDIYSNGKEAVDAYKSQSYDIVLMDCDMPLVDGFQASEAIRRYEQETAHKRTPIIAVSLTVLFEDMNLYKDAGIDDYLAKPFEEKELHVMLNKWNERKN